MLLLALSSLQGRPMRSAFDELAPLADGIQLTPGNHPTPNFQEYIATSGRVLRTHHGFAFDRRVARVWDESMNCLSDSQSVHPPEVASEENSARFRGLVEAGATIPSLETMYPGYVLGNGDDLEWAMRLGLSLAVDVSHLYIQKCSGVIRDDTLRRIFDYLRIAEIHVSANDGTRDRHAPLDADSFGLDWAREHERSGSTIILEGYFHRLNESARKRQIDLLKE